MDTSGLVYTATQVQVARALLSSNAYCIRLREAEWFTWKSGLRAPVYTDCRVLAGHPGATAVIKRALGSSIRANFANYDYVIGMAEAGIIWSTLAADELSLPHAFVRKSKKAYGRSEWIECSPPTGIRAVLIDDLTASGETLVDAIEKLSKAQITTVGVQSIVNWDFAAMRQRFDCLGMPVKALVSYPQLLDEALACHVLSTPAVEELNRFYQSPKTHRWNLNALSAPRVDSEARVS